MGEACCKQSRNQLSFPEQLSSAEHERKDGGQYRQANMKQGNIQLDNKIMPVENEDTNRKAYKKFSSWSSIENYDQNESEKEGRERIPNNNECVDGHRCFEKSSLQENLHERQIPAVNEQVKVQPLDLNHQELCSHEVPSMKTIYRTDQNMEANSVKTHRKLNKVMADGELTSRTDQRLLHEPKMSLDTEKQTVRQDFNHYRSDSGDGEVPQQDQESQFLMEEENFKSNEMGNLEYKVENDDFMESHKEEEYVRKQQVSYLKPQQTKPTIGRIIFKTPEFQAYSTKPKINSFGKRNLHPMPLERLEEQDLKFNNSRMPLTISKEEKQTSEGIKNCSASQSMHAQTQMSENILLPFFHHPISFMPVSSPNLSKQNTGRFNSPLISSDNIYRQLQGMQTFGAILETSPLKEHFEVDVSQQELEESPAESHLRSTKVNVQRQKFTFSPDKLYAVPPDQMTPQNRLSIDETNLGRHSPNRMNESLAVVEDNKKSGLLRMSDQSGSEKSKSQAAKTPLMKLVSDTPFVYESLSSINDPLEELQKSKSKSPLKRV